MLRLGAYNNNLYAVWIDDTSGSRDIYFKRSTNDGCTFDGTINLSNQSGGSIDPEIAVSGNNLYVVWEHTPVDNGAIFFTKKTDGGPVVFLLLLIWEITLDSTDFQKYLLLETMSIWYGMMPLMG